MSDHDVAVAKAAFAQALPDVEYHAGVSRTPRPHTARYVGALAGAAVIAAGGLFAFSATTNTAPAWSATPAHLTSAQSSSIDQQCRDAKSQVDVVGNGQSTGSDGVSVSAGDSTNSGLTVSGNGAPGSTSHLTMTVGNLPLLLIDSRGSMAVALYGDDTHTVMCTIDTNGGTSISPNVGPWSAPANGQYISQSGGAVIGMISVGQPGGSAPSGVTRLLGRASDQVTNMTVDVPGVGTVTAEISNGYYSIFIPNSMFTSSTGAVPNTAWPVHLTLADGSTHTTTVPGGGVGPAN